MTKLVAALVGRSVLPAQNRDCSKWKITKEDLTQLNAEGNFLIYKKYAVNTNTDGITLDTFEVKHYSQVDLDPESQRYIINFVGNGMCYEYYGSDIQRDAFELKANVIGFNFRGVSESTGRTQSKDNLVADGITQVQRLLDKGVLPENIILKGHSLGGAVASLVAAHFHAQKQPIYVFNSCSFSNITDVIEGRIRLLFFCQNENLIGKALAWLTRPLIKYVLRVTNWEIDAASAFKTIPEEYRDYIVVRGEKKAEKNRGHDGVIPYYASIHKALTEERREKKVEIETEIENSDDTNEISRLRKQRERISCYRKMKHDFKHGHNQDWESLHNRYGVYAHSFFNHFVARVVADNTIVRSPVEMAI